MSVKFQDGNVRTFTAGAALGLHLRVKLDGTLAGATDVEVGTVEEPAAASGDQVGVRLRTASGTQLMIAAGVIAANAVVYAAANGMVDDSGSVTIGHNVGPAAAASGDWVEVLRDNA